MTKARSLGVIVRGLGLGLIVSWGGQPLRAMPRLDLSGEVVWADDVQLGQANGTWRWEHAARGLTGEVSLAANTYAIDYRPVRFDFRGEARTVRDDSQAVQTGLRWRTGPTWEWIGSLGLHRGFTNYRSLWLAEYFRQQFEPLGVTVPGDHWVAPDPQGGSAGVGGRWEYVRASGFLQAVVTALNDRVAPGYEIDFDGLHRGRTRLDGVAVTVSSENVLSPRLRSRVEVRASRVSARDWRYGGEAALNVACGERTVVRLALGGATERPRFHAWYGAVTGDWAWSDAWGWFLQARYYADTGEIEDALRFTSAAPGLRSRQGGAGVRWRNGRSVWRLAWATLRSDQEPTHPRLDFFQHLYRDRRWTVLQLSCSLDL